MKFDKENIMQIEFVKNYGEFGIPMIALFNQSKVTEAEALDAVNLYGMSEPQNIIFVTKAQFYNVFMTAGDAPADG